VCFLYTAKGASAFLVPVANIIADATGGWHVVFMVTALMNFLVVALALGVLRPLRARMMGEPRLQLAGAD
jgi:OFA family oxalate/formate antiporter-like MFS transporter